MISKSMPKGINFRAIVREIVPVLIFLASGLIGHFIGMPYTFLIAGGLVGAVVRMVIRPADSTTINPKVHWLWTILISASFGSVVSFLVAGWSRNWRVFIVQIVLAQIPIAMGIFYTAQSFLPGGDIQMARKQMAQIQANPGLVAEEISYFTEGFEKGDLVYLNTGQEMPTSKDMLGKDAWIQSIADVMYTPPSKIAPAYSMTRMKRMVNLGRWNEVAVFMSPQAIEANYDRDEAYTYEITGQTIEDLINSEGGMDTYHELDFPYYPTISMVTCQYDSDLGKLIGVDAPMAAYYLDLMEIDAFQPLVDMCQKVASGYSLEAFPTKISSK